MPTDETPPGQSWTPPARAVASLLLATYLAAVTLPPLAGPPPASELAGLMIQPFRPLVGGLYLGHGYRFFAPDPGPGHSIEWTMRMPDGTERSGSIPDEKTDRPRLLYHRRFMISEKIAALVPTSDAPEAIRVEARREWQPLVQGIAAHLLQVHGGTQVALRMVEHDLPTPQDSERSRQGAAAGEGADLVTPLGAYTMPAAAAPGGSGR